MTTGASPGEAPAPTAVGVPAPPVYPIARPAENDPRFNFGLLIDIRGVLAARGFPMIHSGDDMVRLQEALFVFIYGTSSEAKQGGEGR